MSRPAPKGSRPDPVPAAAVVAAATSAATAPAPYAAFDHLATMVVAVVNPAGDCVFANASFENVMGLSRRSVQRGPVFNWFVDPQPVRETVAAVCRNDFSTSRLEALLRRTAASHPAMLRHVMDI